MSTLETNSVDNQVFDCENDIEQTNSSDSETSSSSEDEIEENDDSTSSKEIENQKRNPFHYISGEPGKTAFNSRTPFIELQRHHSWLYYDAVHEGYKCKVCELFPESISGSRGRNKGKFSVEVVKDLSDHPKRYLLKHENSSKHIYATSRYQDFQSQHTIQTLEKRKTANDIHKSNITESALLKLMKISVFMVKKHWSHVNNYEDFVRFLGNDLQDLVLSEYLKLTKDRENATYLSKFTVAEFLKLIGEYMEEEALKKLREAEHFTILLDESTDEANRSELALIARVIDPNGNVENHFLTLIHLTRCNAQAIFTAVYDYLKKNGIDFSRIRLSGMDGCPTMLGDHNGVTAHLRENCSHHSSIHCRNHRLALCFSHLIPFHKEFEHFDGLLLNLFLLLKNSTVKSSIFAEVQQSYNMESLKLVKAAVTRWLSHGKAAQRVLDRYPQLVEALGTIYDRKKEPAVQGLLQQLTTPGTVATLCFLADVLNSTNSLQTFLQKVHLNFLDVPAKVEEILTVLESLRDDPCRPDSNFGKLDSFLKTALSKERTHCTRSRSHSANGFTKERYIKNVTKPFLADLIQEIKSAFDIPDHLKGFVAFDPQKLPGTREELSSYGTDLIKLLCEFYGKTYHLINQNENKPKMIDNEGLKSDYEVFKIFAFKERFEYENNKTEELENAVRQKNRLEQKLKTMGDLLSDRNQIKERKSIKEIEKKIEELKKSKKITFDILRKKWHTSGFGLKHSDVTKMLNYAALIPPSTAEVERVFSKMKLICTRLRKSLKPETVGHSIRVSKFRELTDGDYKLIIAKWLSAENTKSKKRKISSYLKK